MLSLIREDLNLRSSGVNRRGYPIWTIHDPVRNKFFQIEWRVFEVLRQWKKGTAKLVSEAVNMETSLNVDEQFVLHVEKFLNFNELCQSTSSKRTQVLFNQNTNSHDSWLKWLLHHYLFFRIPIFKCDKFLSSTLPYIKFIFSNWFVSLSILSLFLGLFLITHQWDVFINQFGDFMSPQGILFFFFTLIIVKIAHEFGHAFAAKKYGCKVPVMGVAFLVLWPMFYTDTNESWKLKKNSERFSIARAGLAVELMIAAFATLIWNFLPPGFLRDMTFVMATITWVSSLAINASPFMRFDGYYLLSDLWEIPNLHERSGNLARWWLREKLFCLNASKPENFEYRTQFLLILFAFCTWIYRFILFVGIAILVYNFFFKALGILLFVTEIIWFIMRPIWLEIREWKVLKNQIIAQKRSWLVCAILFLLLALLFIPWRQTIVLEAVINAEPYKKVFIKTGGRLEEFLTFEGALVKKGELLARFENPNLAFKLETVKNQINIYESLLQLSSFDKSWWKRNAVIAADLAKLESEKEALDEKIMSLNIYAPISGKVTQVIKGMFNGQWLGEGEGILSLKGQEGFSVTAYINEENVSRVKENGSCHFIFIKKSFKKYECALERIAPTSELNLKEKILTSPYGGSISATQIGSVVLPNQALYKLSAFINLTNIKLNYKTIGLIEIDAERRNIIERFWRWFLAIIIRESGL